MIEIARFVTENNPKIVGVTGRISIGKSTFARALVDALRHEGETVQMISTDDFLYSDKELEEKKIKDPRGFPKTYDSASYEGFLTAVKNGDEATHRVYSHEIYDITDETRTFRPQGITILEGVNLFYDEADEMAFRKYFDYVIYLDQDPKITWEFYFSRVHEHIAAAEDPDNFFYPFRSMSEAEIERISLEYWNDINMENDRRYIAPTKEFADLIVTLDREHKIAQLEESTPKKGVLR